MMPLTRKGGMSSDDQYLFVFPRKSLKRVSILLACVLSMAGLFMWYFYRIVPARGEVGAGVPSESIRVREGSPGSRPTLVPLPIPLRPHFTVPGPDREGSRMVSERAALLALTPNLAAELGLSVQQRMELQKSLDVIAAAEIGRAAESLSFVDQWMEEGCKVYQVLLHPDEASTARVESLVQDAAKRHLDDAGATNLAQQLKLGVREFFGAAADEIVIFEVYYQSSGGAHGLMMNESSWIKYSVIDPHTGAVVGSSSIQYRDLNLRLGRRFSFPLPNK